MNIRTRADSLGKKSLLKYARNDGKRIKKVWICVCEASNFERNTACRNCRRPKEEGFQKGIEVNLRENKPENQKVRQSEVKETSHELEVTPDAESEPKSYTDKSRIIKRRPGGKGR